MYKFVVAGGGSASVSVVGQLVRTRRVDPSEILVIEPSPIHNYQPGWTMVGGGLLGTEEDIKRKSIHLLRQHTNEMFNSQVNILQKEVTGFDPENNKIIVTGDQEITYENLIVALGLRLDYDSISGLTPALEDSNSPVGSIYRWQYALKMNKSITKFKGGNAVFCMPAQPVKCGGAPQKIMYLAKDQFVKNGVNDYTINYYMPQPAIFGVPKYGNILQKIAESKGINVHSLHTLTKVDKDKRIAYFKKDDNEIQVQYDLLHVTPLHKPLEVLKNSSIVDSTGFVNIDKFTLRHVKYPNVWSLGDCSNLPTSKTLAAALSQTNVLVHNIFSAIDGRPINAMYSGYSSCPIFVGQNKLLLCEFKYDGALDESFPFLQGAPHIFFYWMKRYFFPRVYLHMMKRGWWFGKHTIFRPNFF